MDHLTKSLTLSPQGRQLFAHMDRTGSISAREAMADYGITSATLARRICDMEEAGIPIERETKNHPITNARYTRYTVAAR